MSPKVNQSSVMVIREINGEWAARIERITHNGRGPFNEHAILDSLERKDRRCVFSTFTIRKDCSRPYITLRKSLFIRGTSHGVVHVGSTQAVKIGWKIRMLRKMGMVQGNGKVFYPRYVECGNESLWVDIDESWDVSEEGREDRGMSLFGGSLSTSLASSFASKSDVSIVNRLLPKLAKLPKMEEVRWFRQWI